MKREFSVEASNLEEFPEFFYKIPQQNMDAFINILLFVNYTVNGTELRRKDLEDYAYVQFDRSITKNTLRSLLILKRKVTSILTMKWSAS